MATFDYSIAPAIVTITATDATKLSIITKHLNENHLVTLATGDELMVKTDNSYQLALTDKLCKLLGATYEVTDPSAKKPDPNPDTNASQQNASAKSALVLDESEDTEIESDAIEDTTDESEDK